MASTATDLTNSRTNHACFDATLVAALAYGALIMLFCQFIQAILLRPKRGRVFYGIIAYSVPIFVLSTVAIGGIFRFSEMVYIDNRMFPDGAKAWYEDNSGRWENVMTQACATVMPWIGNLLMLYRVYVLWNSWRYVVLIPSFLYLADIAISIPFLIGLSRPHDPEWSAHVRAYATAYWTITVAFNLVVTALIITRLIMLRQKVEQVMGKVQSVFYTSHCTTFVESGAFFTLWSFCHLILFARNSWIQDVFLFPAMYIAGITRIMIIIRMAQNNAWSRDMITASVSGILDWQVSSSQSHSFPMHDQGNQSALFPSPDQIKGLPKKFRDDGLCM